MRSAGSLIYKKGDQYGWWNLSSASGIAITRPAENRLTVRFHNQDGRGDMPEWTITTSVELDADSATLRLRVLAYASGYHAGLSSRLCLRQRTKTRACQQDLQ